MLSLVVYSILLLIYLIVLWLTPAREPAKEDQQPVGESDFTYIVQGTGLFWFISLILPYITPSLNFFEPLYWVIVGLILSLMGTAIRMIAIRTLGDFFTYELCIRKEHTIIQHGLYKYIRHPSYTGSLFEVIGMMVVARSLIGLLVFLAAAGLLFKIRIEREERMLREEFGVSYIEYSKRTKRLIPWVF